MASDRVLFCFLSFFIIFLALITGGCKQKYSLKSTWLDRKIVIDGIDKDWGDKSRYYDEKTDTKISIYNDNDSLYLCLESMDPAIQMSILRHGLTIWLCETGKSETVWGLRYPLMVEGLQETPSAPGGFDKPKSPEKPTDMKWPPETPFVKNSEDREINVSISDVYLILGPKKEPGTNYASDELGELGIFCKLTHYRGIGTIYEIKIPLNKSERTPYAARLSSKQIVSIALVTEKVSDKLRPDRDGRGRRSGGGMGGGPPGGGMGGGPPGGGMGGRGPMGGMPGMGGGPMGGKRAEALDLWADIELSSNPAF